MSTPIITSAPIAFTCSTGKLFVTPPSVSNFPSISTGANNVGKAPLAKMASGKNPLFKTSSLPVSKLVAMQTNGIGNLLKSLMLFTCCVKLVNKLSTFCPFDNAVGIPTFLFIIGMLSMYFSLCSLS